MLAGLILSSCANESPELISESAPPTALDRVLKNADQLYDALYKGTRSGNRKISSVEKLSSKIETRSAGDDEGMYIVNYGNDQGFAVVSTIPGSAPVCAISDEGSLHEEDINDNAGLNALFSAMGVGDVIAPGDSTVEIGGPSIADSTFNLPVEKIVGPLIPPLISKWDAGDDEHIASVLATEIVASLKYCEGRTKEDCTNGWRWWDRLASYQYPSGYTVMNPPTDAPAIINKLASYYSTWYGPCLEEIIYSFGYMMEGSGYEVRYRVHPDPCGFRDYWMIGDYELRTLMEEEGYLLAAFAPDPDRVKRWWLIDGYMEYGLPTHGYYRMAHCVWGCGGKWNGYYFIQNSKFIDGNYLDLPEEVRGGPNLWGCMGIRVPE